MSMPLTLLLIYLQHLILFSSLGSLCATFGDFTKWFTGFLNTLFKYTKKWIRKGKSTIEHLLFLPFIILEPAYLLFLLCFTSAETMRLAKK